MRKNFREVTSYLEREFPQLGKFKIDLQFKTHPKVYFTCNSKQCFITVPSTPSSDRYFHKAAMEVRRIERGIRPHCQLFK